MGRHRRHRRLCLRLHRGPIGAPTAAKQSISGLTAFYNDRESFYAVPLQDTGITAFCPDQPTVKKLAALVSKERPSLSTAKDSQSTLARLLERVGDGDITAAWLVKDLTEETLAEVPMGLADETTAVGFSVSDRLIIAIQGSPSPWPRNATRSTPSSKRPARSWPRT